MFIDRRDRGLKYDTTGNVIFSVYEIALRYHDIIQHTINLKLIHPYKMIYVFANMAGELFSENCDTNPYRHPAVIVMLSIISQLMGIDVKITAKEYDEAIKICKEKVEQDADIPNVCHQPNSDAYLAARRAYKRYLMVDDRFNNELNKEEHEARGWIYKEVE
jgi:hypothetical protein